MTAKILVVDDEPTVRATASDILRRFGYDVVTAVDGQEAVEHVSAYREGIRLVLLDYAMPRMNGEDAFYAIRAILPGVCIILSSGCSTTSMVQRLSQHGLSECLPKPYSAQDLASVVGRLLSAEAG